MRNLPVGVAEVDEVDEGGVVDEEEAGEADGVDEVGEAIEVVN